MNAKLEFAGESRNRTLVRGKERTYKREYPFLHETGLSTHLGIVGLLIHHGKFQAVGYLVRRNIIPDRSILAENTDAWKRVDAYREEFGQEDTRESYTPLRLTNTWTKKKRRAIIRGKDGKLRVAGPDTNGFLAEVGAAAEGVADDIRDSLAGSSDSWLWRALF